MRVLVLAVGRLRERGLRAQIDEYAKRIGRHARLEEREIRDGAQGDVEERVRRAIPDRSRVVALEVEGTRHTSESFARLVGRSENDGIQTLVFLVGGSHGLPPALSVAADERVSLSAMTLPHRLARLLLVEQIYRAFTILRGEPYAH